MIHPICSKWIVQEKNKFVNLKSTVLSHCRAAKKLIEIDDTSADFGLSAMTNVMPLLAKADLEPILPALEQTAERIGSSGAASTQLPSGKLGNFSQRKRILFQTAAHNLEYRF